jgi:hypothetical protein
VARRTPSQRSGHRPLLARYTVTVRSEGTPHKHRFDRLDAALAGLEREAQELVDSADHRAYGGTLIRRLDPARIVVARLELSGPRGLRAGVDVRGDGSSEAFSGRIRRRVLEQRDGESAYDALRRELS